MTVLVAAPSILVSTVGSKQAQRKIRNIKHPRLAIALKTGNQTISRAELGIATFLKDYPHLVIVSDNEATLANRRVIDVVSESPNSKRKSMSKARRKDPGTESTEEILLAGHQLDMQGWYVVNDQHSPRYKFSLNFLSRAMDSHKFLPGLRVLFLTYPNSDWYLMIDDDAYVFLDSLIPYLNYWNSAKPLYLGSPNQFSGCDGVKNFGDGPLFAHGGSGILISRPAIERMLKIVDSCVKKYQGCWAGDVRLGLCMRDAGIPLTHLPDGFHGNPPDSRFNFDQDACVTPKVLHKLLPKQNSLNIAR
ncbi:hypothetical protein HK100_003595 [Physocladia obscura]|uniref:N-acetylgalactosaminide beta-1,3-galactosyltransferase n=1 Tax=Physocladia obscura TaxID=109957 RepID=A0AAD5TCN2_9FUNG|nr:hypothetical protein HK100_003595 [Physocladia obscura]